MNGINLPTALAENSQGLKNFFTQNQKNLQNLADSIKQIQQEIENVKNSIDNALKEIEMDFEYNQSILSRWVASSNNKLKQEQISDVRRNLLNEVKKIGDNFNKLTGDLDQFSNDFDLSAQQFIVNFQELENISKNVIPFLNNSISANSIKSVSNISQNLQQVIEALNGVSQGLAEKQVVSNLQNSLEQLVSQ